MLLVPRQLRRSGMTGSVPYYGGRLTPEQAYAASHPRRGPQPPAAQAAPTATPVAGPVQVLVVGFDRPAHSGAVLAELGRLRDAGIVRLVDVLLVSRAADGSLRIDPAPEGAGGAGRVTAELLSRAVDDRPEADGAAARWSLADAVPPGSTAAVALIEHVWAQPLSAVIAAEGGRPLVETWLARDDVVALEQIIAAAAG